MHLHVQRIAPPPAFRARNVVAVVQLTIQVDDYSFTISGISVLRGADSIYLRMPKTREDNGAYVPFISLSARMKRAIEDAVLPAVEKWAAQQSGSAQVTQVQPANGGAQ
jgi:DNA-binding cell septation regulator SpoVG